MMRRLSDAKQLFGKIQGGVVTWSYKLQVTQFVSFLVFLVSFLYVLPHGLKGPPLDREWPIRALLIVSLSLQGIYLYFSTWCLELSDDFSAFRQQRACGHWRDILIRICACTLINIFPLSAKDPHYFLANLLGVSVCFLLWDKVMYSRLHGVVEKFRKHDLRLCIFNCLLLPLVSLLLLWPWRPHPMILPLALGIVLYLQITIIFKGVRRSAELIPNGNEPM